MKKGNETYITEILNVFDNEVVILIKDKSAHSIVLKDGKHVEIFIDFIQSIVEKNIKLLIQLLMKIVLKFLKNSYTKDLFISRVIISCTLRK